MAPRENTVPPYTVNEIPNLPYFTFPHKMESIKSRLRIYDQKKKELI